MAPFQLCPLIPTSNQDGHQAKNRKRGDEILIVHCCFSVSRNELKFYTFLKGTHPGTIPARFGLIWFSGFREEDLNVIFYQNMPNLHNRYISAERKISQKNPEYMLNYSLPCKLFTF
jgi:hypothetical protein